LIHEGKVRALAVTSEARNADLPDVPTMIESGLPRLTRGFWVGLLAPANTPTEIVTRLNAEINASTEMRAELTQVGFDLKIGSPQDPGSISRVRLGATYGCGLGTCPTTFVTDCGNCIARSLRFLHFSSP